jgi:hypothetical protein
MVEAWHEAVDFRVRKIVDEWILFLGFQAIVVGSAMGH